MTAHSDPDSPPYPQLLTSERPVVGRPGGSHAAANSPCPRALDFRRGQEPVQRLRHRAILIVSAEKNRCTASRTAA